VSKNNTTNGITLGMLIKLCGGKSYFSKDKLDIKINKIINDSRTAENNDVFVALETLKDDGHKYVADALQKGVVAALVAEKKINMFDEKVRSCCITVKDPLKAIQNAAMRYRRSLNCKIIGITGSSGKTTTRAFIADVLSPYINIGQTIGNFNNNIGVPISLLKFTGKEKAGILELGTNHPQEIEPLSKIIRPDICLILNIGYAHIGNFGSLSNIAKEKFKITSYMKKNGLLILNGDDSLLVKYSSKFNFKKEFYGFSNRCNIKAEHVCITKEMHTRFSINGEEFIIPMPGRHFVYAALAAIAIALKFGLRREQIRQSLLNIKPQPMRGTIEERDGKIFILDYYNANPSSMKSAIDFLNDVAGDKKKVAIVGDMLELGKYSKQLHTKLGKQIAKANVKKILAIGEYSSYVLKGALLGGIKKDNIYTAKDCKEALPLAKKMLQKGDVVLLKASRGIHLETLYQNIFNEQKSKIIPNEIQTYNKKYLPKKVAVIGAARSGICSAKYLKQKGIDVFLSDICSKEKLEKLIESSNLKDIKYEYGNHSDKILDNDLIILSPGVRSDLPILQAAKIKGIPIWSEIELAYRITDAKFLAVTGSSGKSTTVSILGEIFKTAKKNGIVAGNIGIPLVKVVENLTKDDFVIAEISSFQLENIDMFRPFSAAIINLMKNHLDRYEKAEDYYNAKKNIAKNFTKENFLILNKCDKLLYDFANQMKDKTNIFFFGEQTPDTFSIWIEDTSILTNYNNNKRKILDVNDMFLKGKHNWFNACAAAALALTAGIEDKYIKEGICSFKGLPHRMEFIEEINGVKYYNDSKATTAESVLCAINSFEKGVHLISGGRDKGCDFSILKDAIKSKVKNVYLIGEAAKRIYNEWKGLTNIETYDSLESALHSAKNNAVMGDVVILSPGCSSFDMFENYEHRGETFAMIVRKLKEESL